MEDKICIDDDAAAFEEWARLVNIYDSMPTIEDAFAAGLQRGKAHGAAEEQERAIMLFKELTNKWFHSNPIADAEFEARIRQQGEK